MVLDNINPKRDIDGLIDWLHGFLNDIDWGFELMNDEAWKQIKRFEPHEFDYPDKLDTRLLVIADAMVVRETRFRPGLRFIVHSDYRPGDPKTHGMGWAMDGHFEILHQYGTREVLPVEKQFWIAARYPFCGVGIYPYWNKPGIHIDVKPRTLSDRGRFWWKDANGTYRAIESYFIAEGW